VLQYKIPQNVGIEDKIVGPFSLRQLIILAVGAGISYVLFAITSRIYELNVLEYILIALPAMFALAAAMLKIHNVTFIKYLLLMLEFAIKPKKRMWDHRGISAIVAPDLTDKTAAKKKEVAAEEGKKSVNLRDISATLDSGGFEHVEQVKHEDIDEAKDDDLITEAYFGHKKKESSTENMYWRTKDMQKKKLDLLAKIEPTAKPAPATKAPTEPTPAAAAAAPAQPAPAKAAPAKKESVAQHLAGVIKEARESNQAKKEAEKATEKPETPPSEPTPPAITTPTPAQPATATVEQAAAPSMTEAPKKKRRRRRRKKKKPQAGPVRQDTQVDTTTKTEPKLIKKTDKKEGETSFGDLSGGGEIEINLD
jgi:hypothetical protein